MIDDEGRSGRRFAGLAAPLQRLQDDALRIWGDATERRQALEAILNAWETSSPDLSSTLERVDRAILEGLRALGLPRGPAQVRIEYGGRGWSGRKDPDCSVIIAGDAMRLAIRALDSPDSTFRTWIHESLHARQPFSPQYVAEQARYGGYEEGMVEGLARIVTIDRAGLAPRLVTFEYYVQAYRMLAQIVGVQVEDVWRRLWRYPAGQVRIHYADTVARLCQEQSGRVLSMAERSRLSLAADRLFDSNRDGDVPDSATIDSTWRRIIFP